MSELVLGLICLILDSGLDGMLFAEVPNSVKLSQSRATDEEVDCCKRVVDGSDDERVSDPDHARCGKSDVLRDGDLIGWSGKVFQSCCDEAPLHERGPEEDCFA